MMSKPEVKQSNPAFLHVVSYNTKQFVEHSGTALTECLVDKLDKGVTWVNVVGLNAKLINEIAARYHLHALTVEDILNVEQRSKIEEYEGYTFVVMKLLRWDYKKQNFTAEHFSLVFNQQVVISFCEKQHTLFDHIYTRLQTDPEQLLRQYGSDYLTYRVLDTLVDEYFEVLEGLGERISAVEELIIAAPTSRNMRALYQLKRQVLLLRKAIWPSREMVSHLLQGDAELISDFTRIYLRDVHDHVIQAIDMVEIFRDMLSELLNVYLSSITNRLNEIMKVLTIVSTIFIPISFIANIYGMNVDIPGLHWHGSFPLILLSMLLITVGMLIYFWRKKWL